MGSCEMCGAKTTNLSQTKIAGTLMSVCKNCKGFGVSESSNSKLSHTFKRNVSTEVSFEVKDNFASEIMRGLSKKNLNVHQLAKTLNIKESSVSKYMTGKIKPDLNHARQISAFLNIDLVREENNGSSVEDYMSKEETPVSNSLGDLLKKELEKKND